LAPRRANPVLSTTAPVVSQAAEVRAPHGVLVQWASAVLAAAAGACTKDGKVGNGSNYRFVAQCG